MFLIRRHAKIFLSKTNMSKMRNVAFLTNTRIQKEQLQLSKIQNELEKIIVKVNEAINELKVEELQLKAGSAAALSENYRSSPLDSAFRQEQPSTSLSLIQLPQKLASNGVQNNDVIAKIDAAVINQQFIDLNMQVGKNGAEEEDDEDM